MDFSQLEGVELDGRFRLGEMLGAGGYGAVFEAEQLSVQRRCAVKILLPKHTDERMIARFRAEARATARLVHSHSVQIYDFGQDHEHGLLYLAMEYLEGRSLHDVLKAHGRLSVEETVHIVAQIAESLDEAHNQGLVHRDIKPHNIMLLAREGDAHFVKVIDFGIAKMVGDDGSPEAMEQLTATDMMVGTPTYMAPEQIRGREVSGATDQYALAVTIYKMLTGRGVFTGASPMDVAVAHMQDTPARISTYARDLGVDERFERVLLKALSKSPEDRFGRITEFGRALDLAYRGEPVLEAEPRRDRVTTAPSARADIMATIPLSDEASALHRMLAEDALGAAPTPLATPNAGLPSYAEETSSESVAPITGEQARAETPVSLHVPTVADAFPLGDVEMSGSTTALATPEAVQRGADEQTTQQQPHQESPPKTKLLVGLAAISALVLVLAVVAFVVTQHGKSSVADAQEDKPDAGLSRLPPVERDDKPTVEQLAEAGSLARLASDRIEAQGERLAQAMSAQSTKRGTRPAGVEVVEKKRERKPKKKRKVSVEVTIVPWGQLVVDGKNVPNTSTRRYNLKLTAKKHVFELEQNGVVKDSKTVDVRRRGSRKVMLDAR